MTTFSFIPIIDEYDVYELRDESTYEGPLVAHTKGGEKLPERKIKIGDVLKELKSELAENAASKKFVEAVYWLDSK